MDTCREHEDSKSSSEEVDQANDDDMGTGRSYECVFCKRGFTTAQALGGHMNIHRKDRAKAKPSNLTKPHHETEYYIDPRFFYSSNPNHPSQISPNFESPIMSAYDHMYFAAATSAPSRPQHGYHIDDSQVQSSRRLNPYQEDWFTSLSLHIGPTHVQDNIGMKKRQGYSGKEEELDLELRLGHHP